jgi:predicted component of type VI protein secretion system
VEELKKKEQSFKRMKENAVSSIWKSEREVRKVIQNSIKKILEVVDEQSTVKVVEATKQLEQSVVNAISIKL